MKTPPINLNVRISKEDFRQLEKLMKDFEESKSQVVRRALSELYFKKSMELKEWQK